MNQFQPARTLRCGLGRIALLSTLLLTTLAARCETLDARYALCVQPNWLTAVAVTEKRPDGFRAEFSVEATSGAKIDWHLIR